MLSQATEPIADKLNYQSATATCLHCGSPTTSAARRFCCSGCQFVYNTITRLGLTEYYKYRTGTPSPVPFIPGSNDFRGWDHPQFIQTNVIRKNEDLVTGTFYLAGIHCAGCVWLIEGLPHILPGIERSTVDFSTGQCILTYHPSKVNLSQIAWTLDSLGYRLHAVSSQQLIEEERIDRAMLLRLGVAAICSMNSMMLAVSLYQGLITGIEMQYANYFRWVSVLISLPAVFYSAVPFYQSTISSLRMRRLHFDTPIAIAICGAFLLSVYNTLLSKENVYFDSVTTLIFLLLVGRTFQRRALRRARAESRLAWSILPAFAHVQQPNQEQHVDIPLSLVQNQMSLVIYTGERIPADGIVQTGMSALDNSILTGESIPVQVQPGHTVFAGTLNLESTLVVTVTAVGSTSRIGRILQTLDVNRSCDNTSNNKANAIGGYFVYAVSILAAITLTYWLPINTSQAIDNTLALLIVTCPCALGLALPLAYGIAISQASKLGVLIKSTQAIDNLANVKHVYLDKTGTLTEGRPEVKEITFFVDPSQHDQILSTIHCLASHTPHHPYSQGLLRFLETQHYPVCNLQLLQARQGLGVSGVDFSGQRWCLGSVRWLLDNSETQEDVELLNQISTITSRGATPLLLTCEEKVQALLSLEDKVKLGASAFVAALQKQGLNVFILSGDTPKVVAHLAQQIGIPLHQALGNLSPEEKAAIIRSDLKPNVMVGDGINDCPAMQEASVAVAVRGGIEMNLEVADIFLVDPSLSKIQLVFLGALKTKHVIHRNLAFSLSYNIAGAISALCGLVNPLLAAVLMPASSLSVVFSSIFSRMYKEEG